MKSLFMMIGATLAWLVSPESLAIFGRGIGVSGILILIPLAAAMILATFYIALIQDSEPRPAGNASEFAILSSAYGRTAAAAMCMTGRIPVFLFASIAMLVSAGFAFNEIFVYWFPNFLFASLLLLTICALHLFQEKVILWVQVVFVGIAILGLAILVVMGLGGKGSLDLSLSTSNAPPFYVFGTVFMLFLGVDFFRPMVREKVAPFLVPFLSFLLLTAWALLAVMHVSPTRLAESTLSHVLIARAVGGDAGRWIIGIAIISGALSGVNGLFLAVRSILTDLSENRFFPKIVSRGCPVAIAAGVVIEIMMMTGFAGDDRIDANLRASLFLWLLYAGFRSIACGLKVHRFRASRKVLGHAVAGVIFMLILSLTAAEPNIGYVIGFQSAAIIVFLLFSFVWTKTHGHFSTPK